MSPRTAVTMPATDPVALPPPTAFAVTYARTTRPGAPLSEEDARRPGEARRQIAAWLPGRGLAPLVDDARQILSELVTNAFAHGSGPVAVRGLVLDSGALELRVYSDGLVGELCPRRAREDAQNGRGLWLVTALTDAWGVAADGRYVWCRLGGDAP
ncbi:ATP-binding protein [Streptomyces sp. NPDC057638]|uniref:ATP-binding protein n=1 Tax=Streptomyces sp. NPDC057638 TaxID=3346190 RepID=UPI00367B317F